MIQDLEEYKKKDKMTYPGDNSSYGYYYDIRIMV